MAQYLFGGDKSWDANDWCASDDRVRGGNSQSHFEVDSDGNGRFHGRLDTRTLGGAGFASQRAIGHWDLSGSQVGLLFRVTDMKEDMTYTIVLKDQDQSWDRQSGREQSTVSYQWKDLSAHRVADAGPNCAAEQRYFCKFTDLEATYRGKEKPDAAPIDKANVRQISIMVRSFFGEQQGQFSITLRSIETVGSINAGAAGAAEMAGAKPSGRGICSMM